MVFTNEKKFNKELKQFSKGLLVTEAIKLHKLVALEALKRIVKKTPVDTGRARGSWLVTIGDTTEGRPRPNTRKRKKGKARRTEAPKSFQVDGKVLEDGVKALTNLPFGSVIYIQNNVKYIMALEEGHSKQARNPTGMVNVTFSELRTIFA